MTKEDFNDAVDNCKTVADIQKLVANDEKFLAAVKLGVKQHAYRKERNDNMKALQAALASGAVKIVGGKLVSK